MSRRERRAGLTVARTLIATLGVLVAMICGAAPARAEFHLTGVGGAATDPDGTRNAQAGAHPDFRTRIDFAMLPEGVPDGNIRDIDVELPRGLVGNLTVTPACTPDRLAAGGFVFGVGDCPMAAQVGNARIGFVIFATPFVQEIPIYNVVAPSGAPALFAFNLFGVVVTFTPELRSSDNGLTIHVRDTSQTLALTSADITLWGVPADPAHDAQRMNPKDMTSGYPADIPLLPLMTAPTDCAAGPLRTTVRARGWGQDEWLTDAFDEDFDGQPLQAEGCDALPFEPTLTAAPDTTAASSPAGLRVALDIPQDGLAVPTALATAHLRKAVVTLPEGMAINPASADGLAACSDAQLGIGTDAPAACPDAAKIGTVEATTPLLRERIGGGIYLLSQASTDPESGRMFRIALVLRNAERGILVKLAGAIRADRTSGRLTATFDDNPQLPLSTVSLAFKGGPRAPLTTPSACGQAVTRWELTSWSSTVPKAGTDAFTVGGDCGRAARFDPSLSAGVVSPSAGSSSPLVMRFGRPDGQQELGALNASLPPGLLGVLKSVPLCPTTQGAAGTCGAASRVGKVQVLAGVGSTPLALPAPGRPEQPVFLTQPYRPGDVAGMSIVVPAAAGPFDLGTVVTQVYLRLRPNDQGIDLQSEPLPRIVGGVPVQVRQVAVTVERAGFIVTPTSCRPLATFANVFSQSWTKASLTSRFQVGDCASLPLSPVIAVAGGGKSGTARFQHPSLKVAVRQTPGQAHLTRADVVLPKAFNVDLQAPSLKTACPRPVYAQDKCSKAAIVGTVRAVTPLLAEPLTGPAFLLQKKGELPDIVMRLRNSQMSLDLIGVLDFLKDSRIITRVRDIPDAALSSFELTIRGGKGGSLLNRADLCARKASTQATFRGHNGKISVKTPLTRIAGCPSKAATSRHASRRATVRARAANQRAAEGRS